jgi:hypothetical protein
MSILYLSLHDISASLVIHLYLIKLVALPDQIHKLVLQPHHLWITSDILTYKQASIKLLNKAIPLMSSSEKSKSTSKLWLSP